MSVFIIEAAGIKAEAERKNVKYIRLTVTPPDGRVRVSVPRRASLESVRAFIEERRDWIAEKQAQCRARAAALPGENTVLLWGKEYPLEVTEHSGRESVRLEEGRIVARVNNLPDAAALAALTDDLMRRELKARLPALSEKWQSITGVSASEWRVRKMKTRWGTCNTVHKRIWLNLRLAMLPPECLEYVIAHELCHLHEPSHNARFKALMDGFYPDWRRVRKQMADLSAVLYIE